MLFGVLYRQSQKDPKILALDTQQKNSKIPGWEDIDTHQKNKRSLLVGADTPLERSNDPGIRHSPKYSKILVHSPEIKGSLLGSVL
jgi:hypothetical protein